MLQDQPSPYNFFLFKKKYARSRKTAWNFSCVVLQFCYFQKCSQQYTLYTVQYYLWCHSPSVRFLVLYRLARLGFIMSAITIMVCIPWTFKWWLRIYQHLENGIIKNIIAMYSLYWGPILSLGGKKKHVRSRKTAWNSSCVVLQFCYIQKRSRQYV